MNSKISVNKGNYEMLCALMKQKEKSDFDFGKAAAEVGIAKTALDKRRSRFRATPDGDPNRRLGSVTSGPAMFGRAPSKSAPNARAAPKRKATEIETEDDGDGYSPPPEPKATPKRTSRKVETAAMSDEKEEANDGGGPARKANATSKGKGERVDRAASSDDNESHGVPVRKSKATLRPMGKKVETESEDEVFDSKAKVETDSEEELFKSQAELLRSQGFLEGDLEDSDE
jgi:hypothetical protein